MPGFIGMPELLLLGVVALLVFGPKRLPEMGRSLGRGMREFKESVTGDNKDDDKATDASGDVAVVTPAVVNTNAATPAAVEPVVEDTKTERSSNGRVTVSS